MLVFYWATEHNTANKTQNVDMFPLMCDQKFAQMLELGYLR